MSTARAVEIWIEVARAAEREGTNVSARHACLACADAVGVRGASLLVTADATALEPVCVTDDWADRLEDCQVTIGQGPAFDALSSGRPVLAGDLGALTAVRRWPLFCPEAQRLGVRAMYSLPLTLGALKVGIFDLHHVAPCILGHEKLLDAMIFADTALLLLLDHRSGIVPTVADDRRDTYGPALWYAEVHQAAGMLSVQLGIPVVDALVRLRAHAYRHGRRLTEVSRDVVERRLRLGRGDDEEPP